MTRKLIAIGGAEDLENEAEIMAAFVRLAHGEKARIVIMPIASEDASQVIPKYRKVLRKFGVEQIDVFDVKMREDATSERCLSLIQNATGILFPGGDQLDITSLIGGTPVAKQIKQKVDAGTVVAGTSAGAAMMSSSMLLSGGSEESPRFGSAQIGPGMDFIQTTIIDTHFSQRGRHGRLMTAVAHYPQTLGLGIDENTALILKDDEFEVVGTGSIIVVDGGPMTHSNLHDLKHGELLELHNLSLHVLPAGTRYNLASRQPVASRAKRSAGRS